VFAPKLLCRTVFAAHVFNCLMLLVFFLVSGLLYYWFAMRRFPDFNPKQAALRLHLFEEGLVVHPPSGGEPVALRWDSLRPQQEITQLVINGVPAPTKYVYSASARGYGTVRITEFYEKPEVWGPRMQDAVMRAQGPAVLEALGEGGRSRSELSRSPVGPCPPAARAERRRRPLPGRRTGRATTVRRGTSVRRSTSVR